MSAASYQQRYQTRTTMSMPHNVNLLLEFDCHIKVEVCTTIKSVKYIFKYIHKGNDKAHIEIRDGHEEADAQRDIVNDEIHHYHNWRYVCPHQAVYKLIQYEMYDKSHTIVRLAIHLRDQYSVYFTDPEQAAHRNNDSMLIAYFNLNQRDRNAHQNADRLELDLESPVEHGWDARGNAAWSADAFPENVEELRLNANEADEDDYDGSNDDALEDEFTDESSDDEF
eukprot:gene16288-biopygen13837